MPRKAKVDKRTPEQCVLLDVVEPARRAQSVSLRDAASWAGMSEANWRQLVNGGVDRDGRWTERSVPRHRVLAMAAAVGVLEPAAAALDADPLEVRAAREAVSIPDPAEEEIMAARHLTPTEKLRLLESLRRLRAAEESSGPND